MTEHLNHHLCRSPYPYRDHLTSGQRHVLITLFIILTPTNLTFNGFLIYGLIKTKQHLNVASRLILSLAISDFCIGLLVQPLVIYLFTTENCLFSWIFSFLGYVFLNYSGLAISLVSFDRFLRLRRFAPYVKRINLMVVNIMIGILAAASVFIGAGMIISSYYDVFCYFNICVILFNGLAATSILVFYIMAWKNIKKQISTVKYLHSKAHIVCYESSPGNVTSLKRQRKSYDSAMTKTIAAILICCCVTYPPYFIVSLLRSVTSVMKHNCADESDLYILPYFASFFLMFVNSSANVILYSYHNRGLKSLLLTIVTSSSMETQSSTCN